MLLGVTQHPAGRGDVKNNLLPAASSAARHAQAARLAHLETFVKAHLLSDNVTDTQGCRRLSLLAGLEDSGPVSLAEIRILKKNVETPRNHFSFQCVKKSRWSSTTYCESGAQNDHIIFLIHVVSTASPVSPSFRLKKWRVLKEGMPVSPRKKKLHLCSPFLVCPSASNGAFKVKYYLLIIKAF